MPGQFRIQSGGGVGMSTQIRLEALKLAVASYSVAMAHGLTTNVMGDAIAYEQYITHGVSHKPKPKRSTEKTK